MQLLNGAFATARGLQDFSFTNCKGETLRGDQHFNDA